MSRRGPLSSSQASALRKSVAVGDKATCFLPVPAYCRHDVEFTPGMVGTVGAVRAPYVRGPGGVFLCVDFEVGGEKFRAALDYTNVKKTKADKPVRVGQEK